MSGLVLLLLFVAGAFVASARLGARGGYGLFSGAEYLFVGALLGSHALGVVNDDLLSIVRPAMALASAFLGLLLGLRLRRSAITGLGVRGLGSLCIETGAPLALVAFGLPFVLRIAGHSNALHGGPIALAIAVVAASSTKSTLAWARTRLHARGPTVDSLEAIARHDDVLSLLALVFLVTFFPPPASLYASLPESLGPLEKCAATAILGLVLGGAFTALAGRRPESDTAWVTLIGVGLLATGISIRLGLPGIAVTFLLGATISATTGGHDRLDELAAQTERPAVTLLLLLIGTQIVGTHELWMVAAAAVALRLAGKLIAGPALGWLGEGGSGAGVGLLGFGGFALVLAAQIALLYRGRTGALVLAVAAAMALAGDLAGPLGLRLLLERRGEIPPPVSDENAVANAAGGGA